MKIEKVSATIRYSQDTGKGAWKVIEIGAEGSIDAREQWQSAQAYLYTKLGKQMKTLWASGSTNGAGGAGAAVNGQNGAEAPACPEPTEKPRDHWCATHAVAYTQRSGKGETWWSHKVDGQWCREPTEKEVEAIA